MTDPTPTEPFAPLRGEPESPAPAAAGTSSGASTGTASPSAAAPAASWSPYAGRGTAAAEVVAERRGGPGTADLLFGLLFTGVGLWLFADITLGLDVPRVRWSDLWPLVLIVLGGWVLLGSLRRR